MEEQYTGKCSEESCAGCSHSGSCESREAECRKRSTIQSTGKRRIPGEKSDRGDQWERWCWKITGDSTSGSYDDRERVYCRDFGCRYYRSIHSENVWSA